MFLHAEIKPSVIVSKLWQNYHVRSALIGVSSPLTPLSLHQLALFNGVHASLLKQTTTPSVLDNAFQKAIPVARLRAKTF